MELTRLDIHSVRNLGVARLDFSASLNAFIGPNGGGKTSLLEAICLLGRGKSFRTHLTKDVVSHGSRELMVYGELVNPEGFKCRLGVSKNRKGISSYKIDGSAVKQSDLIPKFPIQLITPNSFDLLNGAPQERRRFLDWMMFHVEHSYLDYWQTYQRALKQRMEALRKNMDPSPWEQEMVQFAQKIHAARAKYLSIFLDYLYREINLQGFLPVEMYYEPGWAPQEDLLSLLRKNRERDLMVGHTLSGAHRADLRWTIQKHSVAKTLSRGQLKNLIISIHIAQANMILEMTGVRPIWLLDDITSELDAVTRQYLLGRLVERGEQIFLTSVDFDSSFHVLQRFLGEKFAMFHVEHGKVINKELCLEI